MKPFLFLLLIISCFIVFTSCKKDSFITSEQARLSTTIDTLIYDTVFTSAGSITKSFKIVNENNQKLKLSSVKLMGGLSSPFKMNVDGIAAVEITDIEVAANDSVYVFVQVNINPSAANLPFVVSDSIRINYNGNSRFVQLQAYGQNAVFIRDRKLTGVTTWTNVLPYVILGGVTIDTSATLNLNPGCRIFLHADAPIIVDGSLKVNGTKADSVVFRGDRLDRDYKDLPASWPGIIFRNTSKDNTIRFAHILNAYQGLVLQGKAPNANRKLVISQSKIDNAYDAGILCVNSSIAADNCLVSNCGANVVIALGGDYNFTHCTIASYSNIFFAHTNPAFQMTNYITQGNTFIVDNLTAVLRNNIIWGDFGNVEDELLILKQGSTTFNVLLENNLYKALRDPANVTSNNNLKNQPPLFDSINVSRNIFDFHISNPSSPAINKGIFTTFPRDLDNRNRQIGAPDMGAYERQ